MINEKEVNRKLALPVVKIDLGCGLNRHEKEKNEYIYIDGDEADGIDIVCDWNTIPLPDKCADEVHSSDTLEHFRPWEYDITFKELNRIMKVGGRFWFTTPNRTEVIKRAYEGTCDEEWLRCNLHGHQLGFGHVHYNLFTKQSLKELLEKYGFGDVLFSPIEGWIAGECFKKHDI